MKRVLAVTGRSARGLTRICASVALAGMFLALGAEGTQTAVANGDTRTLSFYHTHSKERITVTFKKNGRYDAAGLKELNHFLRDWRNQKETKMEPRLFDVVWEVQNDVGSNAPIHIISAFRSSETNEKLRSRSKGVAKNSQHTLGRAMDIHIPGINMAKVREAGLRLQRGGVGFYPTSGLPFVHLDVGSIRHWPRMTREQLVRVFPDGRTVHLPTDGKPLKNYALALADIKRNGATVRGMPASPATAVAEAEQPRMGKGFLSRFLGGDEDEEATPAAAPETAPAEASPEAPATAVAEAVPMPVARPSEMAGGDPQLAMAYAPQPALPAGPDMVWQRGAEAGRAAAANELPSTTPSSPVAMPMPRPADTTPAALGAPQQVATLDPSTVQPVTASLSPGASLDQSREAALRMLNDLYTSGVNQPAPEAQPAAHSALSYIAAAHGAFAATSAVPVQTAQALARLKAGTEPAPHRTHEIAAVVPSVPKGSFAPDRTARDRNLPLNHPNAGGAAMLAAPASVLPTTFGGNPNAGMRSDSFVGSSYPVLRTVSFGPQRTAQIRSPRG